MSLCRTTCQHQGPLMCCHYACVCGFPCCFGDMRQIRFHDDPVFTYVCGFSENCLFVLMHSGHVYLFTQRGTHARLHASTLVLLFAVSQQTARFLHVASEIHFCTQQRLQFLNKQPIFPHAGRGRHLPRGRTSQELMQALQVRFLCTHRCKPCRCGVEV